LQVKKVNKSELTSIFDSGTLSATRERKR